MALCSLSLLFLSTLVPAQNTTTLGNITTVNVPAGNTIKAGDFITFGFSFTEGSVGQEVCESDNGVDTVTPYIDYPVFQLRNVTAELMVGSAEGKEFRLR
jgi:hypothetical protein